MDLLIASVIALAVGMLGLATAPSRHGEPGVDKPASLFQRSVETRRRQLRAARLHVDARTFTLVCWLSPPLFVFVGWLLGSPVVAAGGGLVGFAVPRLYLDALVRAQRRRTEAAAPHMLQVMLASLTAGRTYLEALQEARARASDRWLRDDLDHIIGQFHLDVPLERSIAEVRESSAGRNLGLIWDNLAICIANRIPASRAKGLLVELASTVQFNVQVQQEVRARTSGQRAQIWLLAAIVPGLFFYLRLINRDFFVVLDSTAVGRYLLFPFAACLEVLGITLSFRLSRVDL
jgi:Flp pilus assembly protein TadB